MNSKRPSGYDRSMGYHGPLSVTHVPSYVRVDMTCEPWQRNTDNFIVSEGDWCTGLGVNSVAEGVGSRRVMVAEYHQDSEWSSRHVFRDADRNRRQTQPDVAVVGSFSQGPKGTPIVVKSFSDFKHTFGRLDGLDDDILNVRGSKRRRK